MVAVTFMLALIGPSCSVSGLQFVEDRRIQFVQPGYREKVQLPVTVVWTVRDFKLTGPTAETTKDSGYFGVLIDVPAVPVGKTLRYYARDDRSCRPESGCPDEKYLADRRIHTTKDTKFEINQLNPAPGVDVERGDRDLHEVTIVLLDGQGHRVSEIVWTQTFELIRK